MTIKNLTDKIIKDANDQKEEILKESKRQVKRIIEESDNKIKELEKRNEEEINALASQNIKRVESSASRNAKIKINLIKRNILDEIFNETLGRLENVDNKEYEKLIINILSKLELNKEGVFFIPKKKEVLIKSILSKLKFQNKVENLNNFNSDFIFKSKNLEYNFDFRKILDSKRKELEIEISKVLFK